VHFRHRTGRPRSVHVRFRVVHDCPNPERVVVLIHGTWARKAKWTERDSPLVSRLIAEFGSEKLAILAFDWSGRNTTLGRWGASVGLRSDLAELRERFPKTPISLIAHSHGGNVALQAASTVRGMDISIVCMSTPFLQVEDRVPLPVNAIALAQSLAPVITFGQFPAVFFDLNGHARLFSIALRFGVAFLVAWFRSKRLVKIGSDSGALFQKLTNYSLRPDLPLLIIRMTDDEATVILTVYRFVDWLLTRYLSVCDLITLHRSIKVGWVCFIWTAVLFCVIYAPGYLSMTLTWVAWTLVVALYLLILVGAAAGGRVGFFGIWSKKVSVDVVPLGHWTVHLFAPTTNAAGLSHSRTYSDSRCIDVISKWLQRQRCPETHLPHESHAK
jgi:alpha-beta hydrolase superfamily lysophospholipase